MPTYDYRCAACDGAFEFFQSMSEGPKRKCPSCGKPKLVRQIGAGAGILFKGSGFYQTDYRSESYKKSASAESPSSDSKAGCTGEAKSCAAGGGPCATPSSAGESKGASSPSKAADAKKKSG